MYKISVPIMSATVNIHNREKYARLCREAGAERIFLATSVATQPIPPSLGENVAYFKSLGFEVGIWTDTIGHGMALTHVEGESDTPAFTPMTSIQGGVRHHANCPLDPAFRKYISRFIADLALTGADIVMLDDDFRMSQHGGELCCACARHLAKIGESLGEAVTLDALRPYVLSGKANKYRDAWIKAQSDGLTLMAREIRAEVDKATPDATVCFCTAYAPWNVDGVDVAQLSRILAGKNAPILRLTGAPYWAVKEYKYPLIATFEIARMLASFVENEGFDLMSEGDVYPRPRYTCPASYLELYDAATRAGGGYTGILKYMFDYTAGPDFELGYLKHHKEHAELRLAMERLFEGGANAGVRVVSTPHTMKHADLDLSTLAEISPRPLDGVMLGSCGIPTLYGKAGVCNSVFGENARALDLGDLADGTVLDAVSAVILTQRGVDVGLRDECKLEQRNISFLRSNDPEEKSFISDGQAKVLFPTLAQNAEVLMYALDREREYPIAYRYENENGQRFLVFLFEGDSIYHFHTRVCLSGLVKNYVTQNTLTASLPWVARAKLPAYCAGNPEIYVMCKKDEEGMSVALFNCFADYASEVKVVLDEEYANVECFNCSAVIEGNCVLLTDKLYGFTYAAFRVSRKK